MPAPRNPAGLPVMILAAGRGERLRPLTDHTPKPLLVAGGKPLIVWHLERLAAAGFQNVVINTAHLGEQIEAALGDGRRFGLSIRYSPEPPGALETAGGIARALPLLGPGPFLVVNGDIGCDWDFARAMAFDRLPAGHAHLVFVDNPAHHAGGDFALIDGRVCLASAAPGVPTRTYSGIGLFTPDFFAAVPVGSVMKMRPLLDAAAITGRLGGERHAGYWIDVGTVERLAELDQQLRSPT